MKSDPRWGRRVVVVGSEKWQRFDCHRLAKGVITVARWVTTLGVSVQGGMSPCSRHCCLKTEDWQFPQNRVVPVWVVMLFTKSSPPTLLYSASLKACLLHDCSWRWMDNELGGVARSSPFARYLFFPPPSSFRTQAVKVHPSVHPASLTWFILQLRSAPRVKAGRGIDKHTHTVHSHQHLEAI